MALIKESKFVFADQAIAEAIFYLLGSMEMIGDYSFALKSQDIFEDTYYDTPTRALQRTHASLRLRRRKNGMSTLQFKKSGGDVSIDMEYMIIECDHPPVSAMGCIHPCDEINKALTLQAGTPEVEPVGSIKINRKTATVQKGGVDVAEIVLDNFTIFSHRLHEASVAREIEIKGKDTHELLYLGQCLSNWFGLIRVTSSKIERHIPVQSSASRLLLDMDPGVDDALALLYLFALKDKPTVDAITTVGGNVNVNQCAINTYRICRWAQDRGLIEQIPPIGIGVDLTGTRSNASNVHGSDGLGDVNWNGIDKDAEKYPYIDAIELQKDVLYAHPGDVTIVATGPCTNLAELIRRYPDALVAAREVIIMGGSFFDCGNRGPQAEFNIHSDSGAARTLVDYCRRLVSDGPKSFKESVPLSFVGLDVTHRTILERKSLRQAHGLLAKLALDISAKYMDFYKVVMGIDGCPLHDPLALGLAIHPEFFVRERYHVEVVSMPQASATDGITIADHRPCAIFKDRLKEVTQVCVSVNAHAFVKDFLEHIGSLQ